MSHRPLSFVGTYTPHKQHARSQCHTACKDGFPRTLDLTAEVYVLWIYKKCTWYQVATIGGKQAHPKTYYTRYIRTSFVFCTEPGNTKEYWWSHTKLVLNRNERYKQAASTDSARPYTFAIYALFEYRHTATSSISHNETNER